MLNFMNASKAMSEVGIRQQKESSKTLNLRRLKCFWTGLGEQLDAALWHVRFAGFEALCFCVEEEHGRHKKPSLKKA